MVELEKKRISRRSKQCRCPTCGYTRNCSISMPCDEIRCPDCGTRMVND